MNYQFTKQKTDNDKEILKFKTEQFTMNIYDIDVFVTDEQLDDILKDIGTIEYYDCFLGIKDFLYFLPYGYSINCIENEKTHHINAYFNGKDKTTYLKETMNAKTNWRTRTGSTL